MTNEEKFYIDYDRNYAVLLGYIMRLTKTELAILKHIKANNRYVSSGELVEAVLAGKDISEGNIAVHICNINKKARAITGRHLIAVRRFQGYKLSDNI